MYNELNEELNEELMKNENDINCITNDILTINEIFKILNIVVIEQGHLIDHIDNNITDVIINVENAEEELSASKEKQNTSNLVIWILWLLFILLIFVLFVYFLIKK